MMQCAVHPKEYSRVSTCTSAKEMWDKLELIYEGTSEVRESKASRLISEYEMFKMNNDETISDMFARFMLIISGLKGLKKEYSESDLVRKILRSLPSSWNTKATVIEDSKDLSKMKLDELIGSLMTYEINVKRKETEENPKRLIALKASKKNSSSSKKDTQQESDELETSSDSENDDMTMLTRQFKKFLKFKRKGSGNSKPFQKKYFSNKFESNKKSDIVCYECKKQGHMRGECSELKKKLKKEKFTFKKAKAMMATWSDEDADEDEQATSGDEQVQCLMARSDDSNEVNSSFESYTIVEWEEAYTVLFEKFCEFKSENKALKKKINSLVHGTNNDEQIASLSKGIEMMKIDEEAHCEEMDILKIKLQETQKEKEGLMNSLESLQSEHNKLKEKLEKAEKNLKGKSEDLSRFVKGKQNLDAILGCNVFVAKHGIGFQPVKPKQFLNKFLENSIMAHFLCAPVDRPLGICPQPAATLFWETQWARRFGADLVGPLPFQILSQLLKKAPTPLLPSLPPKPSPTQKPSFSREQTLPRPPPAFSLPSVSLFTSSLFCISHLPSTWLPRRRSWSPVVVPLPLKQAKAPELPLSAGRSIRMIDLFPNLQPLFDTQGWTIFLYSHTVYSPTAVSEFFNNLGYSEDNKFYTSVKGTPFKLSANLFSTALQIPNFGADILTHHPSASEYYHLITLQPYDGTKKIAKLNANSFPPLNRMIHHIFTTLIAPKHGSRELVTEVHKSLFTFFLKCEQINLPALMLGLIRHCFYNPRRSMPYDCPITSLLRFIGINIPDSECVQLNSRSSFDLTAAHRMGYKLVDGVVTRELKGKAPAAAMDEDQEDDANDDDHDEEADEDSQSEPLDALGDDVSVAASDSAAKPSVRDLLT
ncbi:hypothetical protein Taro_023666 [Colocasia esculenta]|uniref:CCHC-type domain-containing protein n=1 Tax=Colocasia esculenta TaxID=4460 RepID=A0A843V4C9_COLES|nr:hypothetical protein [Colocasia esculenta]